ncbi:alpha/beta hydrolase [Clostridium scatologenes]|uniref:Alpha/beta hydrolase fold protein n=1 Tax=Clostridium scatologenes TaxID=1548 RepID=A0A0E3JYD4_CLOSL|nr:alpha/beta hydrolase [Clostridium scatologenes]AKA68768.1 alpha/beta hydrolase fold protein [Clostridium scatologenes]
MDRNDAIGREVSNEALLMLEVEKVFEKTYLDISYANESKHQKMDIIIPNEGEGPFPVVVNIHGGAWFFGDKRNVHTRSSIQLAFKGYAVATINYRLSGDAKWPAQIYDCKAAVRFLRANSAKYNIKTDKIGVIGNSSGGHLAGVMATTNGRSEYEDLSMGNSEYSSDVQAVAAWYGIFDFINIENHKKQLVKVGETYKGEDDGVLDRLMGCSMKGNEDKYADASPIYQMNANMPPMLIQQGTSDKVVPYLQAIDFFNKYIKFCGDENVHIDILEGAIHGDDAFRTNENMYKVLKFMDKYIMGVQGRSYGEIPEIPLAK